MFVPEYTITPGILQNIASVEYNRSYIENAAILPNFTQRLQKEAVQQYIVHSYKFYGENLDRKLVKRHLDGLPKTKNAKIENLRKGVELADQISATYELDENNIRQIKDTVAKGLVPRKLLSKYRSRRLPNKTDPEEILAEMTELLDWYNGLDAMDTNPIIVSGIFKGQLETIFPFDEFNFVVANLVGRIILGNKGYEMIKYTSLESHYTEAKKDYEYNLLSILNEEGDFTSWLEYYTEGMSGQVATTAEKARLYAKDSKLVKASGKIYLTKRQEKIVEYLQDYGLLQNKQFPLLFPKISEDTVLRDLKKLIDAGIVVKRGSTKLSRYELK